MPTYTCTHSHTLATPSPYMHEHTHTLLHGPISLMYISIHVFNKHEKNLFYNPTKSVYKAFYVMLVLFAWSVLHQVTVPFSKLTILELSVVMTQVVIDVSL